MSDETKVPPEAKPPEVMAPAAPPAGEAPPPAADAQAPAAEAKPAAPPTPKPAAPTGPKKWEPTGDVVENAASKALLARFPGAASAVKNPCGEATVLVAKDKLVEALAFLRDDGECAMNYLSDMTGAHYPNNDKKFEVLYHCYSIDKKMSLRVKVQLDDGETCPTATGVWPGANWMEREAHDMFGVVFEGHPSLKVILLPDNFEGHPLRKEFPLGGAQEEMIRANRFGKPVYLPDDLDAANAIIEERRHGR